MGIYQKEIALMECDFFRRVPPRLLLECSMGFIVRDITPIGGGTANLYAHCGAVWMLSHARILQHREIRENELLSFYVHRRVIEGARYIFLIEVSRGEEQIATLDCSFIPVHKAERRVVRLDEVEPIWTEPPRVAESKQLQRLRPKCEFSPIGCDTVRYSDCDWNGHMTSGAYFDLACNASGFWDSGEPRLMRRIQLDFASEVRPGTTLDFQRGEEAGVRYVRGLKPDGKTAFTAACEF